MRSVILRLLVPSLTFVLLSACTHDQLVKLQERTLAPQRNYGRADDAEAELAAVPAGMTQQQVIDKFGLPIMVHTEGRTLCSPWDSCSYPHSYFVYRSREASTCTIYFASGATDRASLCEPFLKQVVLGPGDIDPRTGMTATH